MRRRWRDELRSRNEAGTGEALSPEMNRVHTDSAIMATNVEDSPAPRASSIAGALTAWSALTRACRRAACSDPAPAVVTILEAAIDALEAERAFVVAFPGGTDGTAPRVEAAVTRRPDGIDLPSRSVLRWASVDVRPRAALGELDDASGLAEQASVRALDLRHALAAAVPAADPIRRALVLDGRRRCAAPSPELESVVAGFAALIAIVHAGSPPAALGTSRTRMTRDARNDGLVGSSAIYLRLLDTARRVARWRLPVLIHGESGAGKEGVARFVHDEGPRADGPFVAINCGAIPESLLESELFGAARGSYSGADQDRPGLLRLAHGGSLFLDEVGDMPLVMQAKLLRVLQEGRVRPVGGRAELPVDIRVIAATHRDLHAREREGLFRGDLLFRLAVIELHVPPLRDRIDDVPLLVDHLLARLEGKTDGGPLSIAQSALHKLASWRWPGNVRELEAVLARALLHATDGRIEAAHIEVPSASATLPGEGCRESGLERAMLEAALRDSAGNLSKAAARIGWSRPKLYRRMRALGVAHPRAKRPSVR